MDIPGLFDAALNLFTLLQRRVKVDEYGKSLRSLLERFLLWGDGLHGVLPSSLTHLVTQLLGAIGHTLLDKLAPAVAGGLFALLKDETFLSYCVRMTHQLEKIDVDIREFYDVIDDAPDWARNSHERIEDVIQCMTTYIDCLSDSTPAIELCNVRSNVAKEVGHVVARSEDHSVSKNKTASQSDNAIECRICRNPMDEPCALECGHAFCQGCVDKWFASCRPDSPPTCPKCRRKIRKKPVPVNKHTWALFQEYEYSANDSESTDDGLDQAGEQKVDWLGRLLGGRRYNLDCFTIDGRGAELFMLASDCIRVLESRLLVKAKSVPKDKRTAFVRQEKLLYASLQGQVNVKARSVFRRFGHRVIINGIPVIDDYAVENQSLQISQQSGRKTASTQAISIDKLQAQSDKDTASTQTIPHQISQAQSGKSSASIRTIPLQPSQPGSDKDTTLTQSIPLYTSQPASSKNTSARTTQTIPLVQVPTESYPHTPPRTPPRSPSDDEMQTKSCPDCGRLFVMDDFYNHRLMCKVEIGRDGKCPIEKCDQHRREFTRKAEWVGHLLTHFKDPFVCRPCIEMESETAYTRLDLLQSHLRFNHGVGSQKSQDSLSHAIIMRCPTCSTVFSDVQDFYDHVSGCISRILKGPSQLQSQSQPQPQPMLYRQTVMIENI